MRSPFQPVVVIVTGSKPNGVKLSYIFRRLPFEFGWDRRMRRLQALRTSPSRKLGLPRGGKRI